ncbi:thioredoxin [Leptolyngbya cf. ectocarpi LEGE 11479]|uniref:Thioredoxin n=1 Tax=Leptolyngbya cf. ectocarpi LEGE 11479 TaxID=1828722 RepID=A0A929F8T4_LEPEC|nr:thioredoxin [Leptolyngbya ectocarpi]MBE9069485.1 thioredoxin [Leptolyngbya cf. ectocarpi LEGE 11479]
MAADYIADEAALDELITSQPLVVMDCTASWCGPCKLVAPLMDQLAEEYGDRVSVVKLDIDANKSVARRFSIKSIPAVLFFKQGEQVDTVIGAKPYGEFSSALEKHL